MSDKVHVALVDGQWIEIGEKDSERYLHTRCLTRPYTEKPSASNSVNRFLERRDKSQKRKGSRLKHEYNPEVNLTWKCVEINGRSQWVEADWNQITPTKLWGFDNSDSDEDLSDAVEPRRTANHAEEGTLRTAEETGTSKQNPPNGGIKTHPQADARPNKVAMSSHFSRDSDT